MSDNYTFQDIFNKWCKPLCVDKGARYTHKNREEILDELALALKAHGVDYEEAKTRKNTVIKFLTTEEGRKGTGKYKDWVVTVEEQYLSALAYYYIPNKELPKIEEVKENLFKSSAAIAAWTKHKFGEFWTEEIEKDCRTKGSHLNLLFQKEIFDTEEIPEYILHAVYGG